MCTQLHIYTHTTQYERKDQTLNETSLYCQLKAIYLHNDTPISSSQ